MFANKKGAAADRTHLVHPHFSCLTIRIAAPAMDDTWDIADLTRTRTCSYKMYCPYAA